MDEAAVKALIAEVKSIPGINSETLQKAEQMVFKLPKAPIKVPSGSADSAPVTDVFSNSELRDALVDFVNGSKAAWEKGEDYGLIGTVVGRLENFEGFDAAKMVPWYK
ncbi:MAG: hypothetical protein QY318_04885 [Candidatus Dojkabacteria bacterium]|nr:MAG: hypothetical protein QY318_04885 [Candidatus Dojkabacteria bacterium]